MSYSNDLENGTVNPDGSYNFDWMLALKEKVDAEQRITKSNVENIV